MKTEPSTYSWDDLQRDGSTEWDGVRNYAARNNMRVMQQGDQVLFYHSVDEKAVVGIAHVSRTAHADPTDTTGTWECVSLTPVRQLKHPVTLDVIKATKALRDMVLVHNSRLSVQPVRKKEFDAIVKMGGVS